MKKKIVGVIGFLLLAMPVLSFVEKKEELNPKSKSWTEYVSAKFTSDQDLFNSKVNREVRAKKLAEQEAAETKKKAQEAQDKGEGQFKVNF